MSAEYLADPASLGLSGDRLVRATALMDEHVASGKTQAAVIAVSRHGETVLEHAVGDARPGGPPLTMEHLFPLASQTKPMAAAVVLALVERGRIGLAEPAARFLPELAERHGDVMVWHLLTHTSGWLEDDVMEALAAGVEAGVLDAVPPGRDALSHLFLATGCEVPRANTAGERMSYASWNYDVLSEIVRRVTGDTFDAAIREFVFEPIGMRRAAVLLGPDLADAVVVRPPGVAFGPDYPGTQIDFNEDLWRNYDSGSGGSFSSAPDLRKFGQMILDRGRVGDTQVLSEASIETMVTNRIPGIRADVFNRELLEGSWSFAFSVHGFNRLPKTSGGLSHPDVLRHGGAGGAWLTIDPSTGVVVSYLEMCAEVDDTMVHATWLAPRLDAVVTAAVLD